MPPESPEGFHTLVSAFTHLLDRSLSTDPLAVRTAGSLSLMLLQRLHETEKGISWPREYIPLLANFTTPIGSSFHEVPEVWTTEFFRALFQASWTRETADPSRELGGLPERLGLRQTAITSLILQELIGGNIREMHGDGIGTVYYVELREQRLINLTHGDLPPATHLFLSSRPCPTRAQLLADGASARYDTLRKRVLEASAAHAHACLYLFQR